MQPQVEILENEVRSLRKQNDKLQDQLARLQHQLNEFKRLVYGVKSERFLPLTVPGMLTLPFAEAELQPVAAQEAVVQTVAAHERKRTSPKSVPHRSELPAHLRREMEVIQPDFIPEDAKQIGEELTETLEIKPAEFYVKCIVRPKYALAGKTGVIIAELPPHPIARCQAGLTLLLRIILDKYLDHLPLWRQIARYKRWGVVLCESTLVGWVKAVAELLEPLFKLLEEEVLNSGYLGADETPVKVLDPTIRGKTHRGYFWFYFSHLKNLVLIHYDPTRKKQVAGHTLRNFQGYLQTDGYAGYHQFDTHPGITRLGCHAHARRKFEKAKGNDKPLAEVALRYYHRIYRVERLARRFKITGEALRELRQRISVPLLAEFKAWMVQEVQKAGHQSPIANAMGYALRNWEELCVYTTDGRLMIDNNLVENWIRPIAIGRKNFMFMGSHNGSRRSAMLYSLVLSCVLNGINPEEYFLDVLKRLPDTKRSELHTLLPNNWKPAAA